MSTASRVELSAENLNNVSGGGVFRIAYEILKKVKEKLETKRNDNGSSGGDKKDTSSGGSKAPTNTTGTPTSTPTSNPGNNFTNNNQGGKQNSNQQGNKNDNSSKGNSIAELNLI